MIKLNDNAIEYMQRQGFKDIVLEAIKYTTWCEPPKMEMSVGFTDKDDARDLSKFIPDESPLGKVYIQQENVAITGPICVRYEKHPWIECFELDGIIALRPKRTGYGTKDAKAFVKSLSTIYAPAYDDYIDYCELVPNADGSGTTEKFDVSGYFAHATERFACRYHEEGELRMLRKYCGFVENIWREGNEEMCQIALELIVPMLVGDKYISAVFNDSITDEFANFIANKYNNR